jgi:hypothetical protein
VQVSGIGARSDPQNKDALGTVSASSPTEVAKRAVPAGGAGSGNEAASKFKRILTRKPSGPSGEPSNGAEASGLSSATLTQQALVSPRDLDARTITVSRPAPPSSLGAVGRVLVGEGPRGSQARVEFRTGPLAGTALQLAAGRDGVHVQLVAAGEGARLALARVVDRVEARLRARGIVMNAATDQARAGGGRDGREQRRR